MKPNAIVDEVRVRDVMNTHVATVHASHSMPLAASIMELERVRHVPVVDDERRVVGLVTHRDILAAQLRVVAAKPAAPLDGPVSLDLSVPVSSVMRTEVWTIQSNALAASAARLLRDHRFGCLPVVDDGKLVGMVTESDLLALVTEGLELSAPARPLKVENAMTLFPITISPDTSIAEARSLMDRYEVRHLPVTNGAHTVGIVSDRDLRVAEAVYRARDAASAQLAVALVGTQMLYEVAPDTLLEVVLAEMSRLEIDAAMVVDAGRLVGVLTTMDACRLFSEYLKTLSARALRLTGSAVMLALTVLALASSACSKKADDLPAPLPPPPASAPSTSTSTSTSTSSLASASASASALASASPSPPPDLKSFPNTAAGAKSLASELAKPDVDAAALSLQLRPTAADYKALFDPPTAAKIDRVYSPEWDKGTFVVSARPGQTEVQMASATVADLKAKNEKAKALPNAYGLVSSHLLGASTVIYAFRFVEPGKNDGNTFDGLVYLNGHWVLIPKPWRGLDTH